MTSHWNFKKYCMVFLSVILASAIGLFDLAQNAQAQHPRRTPSQTIKRAPDRSKSFLDSRYRHNHSYPVRGQAFRSLPPDHRVAVHGRDRYYFSRGVWYRPYGRHYVVVAPPVGLFVPFLPFAYVTIWANGIPYYYANRVYYMQSAGGYVVVDPPRDVVVQTPPDEEGYDEGTADSPMFIYPREGQSEEQQADDRYACHQWAVQQTGFDPTQVTSGPLPENRAQLSTDYQRATAACLESRGYTVR
ncbi:MAG TPA: DUF6515 family protein [Smithella sp.]|nr:DUF6515 family protein [Smithella sp.]